MPEIIQIGDTSYLAGMRWISFVDTPTKAEIKDNAERFDAAWYAVRNGEAIQGGFCDALTAKPPKKLASLAAHLAESKIQPWLGIFAISAEADLYWYIAVRDHHAILPDGDVVGSFDEVMAARQHHLAYGDWQYLEGNLETLAGMLSNQPAKLSMVKSLKGSPNALRDTLIVGSVALGVAAVLGAGYWWYADQEAQEAAQRLANQKMDLAQQANTATEDAIRQALLPLMTLPDPNDFLEACRTIFYGTPVSQAGWLSQELNCEPQGASLLWKREAGASIGHHPPGAPSNDGEQVTQSFPADTLTTRAELPPLIAFDNAELALRDWVQRAGLTLALGKPASLMPQAAEAGNSNIPGLPGTAKPPQEPLPYLQADFSVPMTFSPFDLRFEIPGLFLKRIKTTAMGTYVVEGVLYGKR